ncbi:MAG: DMT family transporter [Methanolobus sp.]|nr:DMT family transporter [Methanolobus sp.]
MRAMNLDVKNNRYSYLELIISCTIFGSSGIFLTHISGMQTSSILFYRILFGFILLVSYIIATKKYNLFQIGKKRYLLLLIGIFNVVTTYSYYSSIKYSGLSVAVLLLYTAPIYVTLLSPLFLKEKMTLRGIISLLVSMIGISMVVVPGNGSLGLNSHLLPGLIFGLISGLSYSGTIMTVNHLKDEYSGTAQLFWSTFISLIILMPFASKVPQAVLMPNLPVLVLFGLMTTAFASLLYLNSASKISAQTVSVLALLEPVSGIIFGFFFLHEPVIMKTIQGCIFILFGACILVWDNRMMQLYGIKDPFMSFRTTVKGKLLDISRITFMWLSAKY